MNVKEDKRKQNETRGLTAVANKHKLKLTLTLFP
jgi:hypothetical protein